MFTQPEMSFLYQTSQTFEYEESICGCVDDLNIRYLRNAGIFFCSEE